MTFDIEEHRREMRRRPLDTLELARPLARALERARRRTVRGLEVLRECDLWDLLEGESISAAAKTTPSGPPTSS